VGGGKNIGGKHWEEFGDIKEYLVKKAWHRGSKAENISKKIRQIGKEGIWTDFGDSEQIASVTGGCKEPSYWLGDGLGGEPTLQCGRNGPVAAIERANFWAVRVRSFGLQTKTTARGIGRIGNWDLEAAEEVVKSGIPDSKGDLFKERKEDQIFRKNPNQ